MNGEAPFERGMRRCEIEETAYRVLLRRLAPLRYICLGGGVVFSGVAGLTIFGETNFIGENWKIWSVLFAFLASILTGLDKALRCEAYQAECRRMIQSFRSLCSKYEAASDFCGQEGVKRLDDLDSAFAQLVETAQVTPTERCYKIAERSARNQSFSPSAAP